MTLPRTVADVLSGHVVFEVECIDRMYLNVYVPQLQYATGLVSYIHRQLGKPVASTAALAPVSEAFTRAVRAFAASCGIPWVDFAKGQRKDDVAREYLAAFTGTEGVLFIGRAQEKVPLFRTRKRRRADGSSYPWIAAETGVVNQFYIYAVDADFGPFFLKFCSYFPFNAKLCINGNEWAKRQAARAGIGFTPLDNGFAAVDDVAGLQAICDALGPAQIDALLRKWLARLPHPFSPADRAAGFRYDISILQAEFSLTQMLDKPVSGRIFFEQVIRDNLDLGRPDRISLIFGRSIYRGRKNHTPGTFATRVVTDGVTPSLHVLYKHAQIKQYHKLGKALRTETTINQTMKAHTFEPTCARWCLKFTGWRAGCLGPGQRRRAGRRRGPCRGPRRRAWDPGWRRDRQAGSPAGSGFRSGPDPAPGPGTGPTPRCAGSWCEW
jgi:hypothetical protein